MQAVLRYQEKVRRDWTQALRRGKLYSIGTVNDILLREFHQQIGMEIQAKNNVSTPPNPLIITKLTNSPINNSHAVKIFIAPLHSSRNAPMRRRSAPHLSVRTLCPDAPLRTYWYAHCAPTPCSAPFPCPAPCHTRHHICATPTICDTPPPPDHT